MPGTVDEVAALQAARRRIVAAEDEARRRLARDLHDGAQQKIVAALVALQRSQGKWSSDPHQAREFLDTGIEQAKAGLGSLRELVAGIHPPILTHLGLAAAIESLGAGMPVPVRVDIMSDRLPPSVEASIYFFVAEGLTNVIKHAKATGAGVRIAIEDGGIMVETTDDGIGGADQAHAGLAGLSDRVEALGGQMTVSSPAGKGTTLTASIPLRPPLATDDTTRVRSWVRLIGYRHEVVHTGVLGGLLSEPVAGPALASRLIDCPVVAVKEVRTMARVPGFAGRADLIARVRADGDWIWMAVETKVDSDRSREQLGQTAAPPHHGVLLAPGLTALKLEAADLGGALKQWHVVGPPAWAQMIREHAVGDLASYVAEIHREVIEHAAAFELAEHPARPAPRLRPAARRRDGHLEDLAWLALVRRHFDDREWWWTRTLQSGPHMGRWPAEWNPSGRSFEVYIEFMCFAQRRILCLKTGGPDAAASLAAADHLLADADVRGWKPPLRKASVRAKRRIAAWIDMTELTPAVAAAATALQIEALTSAILRL